jgi:hypothetical protein
VVELSHLRTEMTSDGSLSLSADTAQVTAITGEGRGKPKEPDLEPLSAIIQTLNERFGLILGEADRLLLDSYEAETVAADELGAQARANTLANSGSCSTTSSNLTVGTATAGYRASRQVPRCNSGSPEGG